MKNENPDPSKAVKNKILEEDIKPDAPFANDALDRKVFARHLTQQVESSATPYTLALDANWGEGKTTFLKMWQADLEKSGFRCVYYDAWTSDFCRDSFPSMVAELKESFSGETAEDFTKKCVAVAKAMAKNLPGSLAGLVGGREVAQAAVDEICGEWEPVAAYSEYREALKSFKSSLEEIARQSEKPLVFMIDELDRCRPTFALDVLEKIKHIFDVPGVFFVAALNKNALAKTIESVYGITDGNDYLSKFFDDTHILANVREIAFYLIKKAGIFEIVKRNYTINNTDMASSVPILSELFHSHSVSLRGQKQIIESIAGCMKKFVPGQKIEWVLFFYFVFLRRRNPSLFAETLATIKEAAFDSDLLSLVPARELIAFVNGQKSVFRDNSTIKQDCEVVLRLADFSESGTLYHIYLPLIYLCSRCDHNFRNEIDKAAPRYNDLLYAYGRGAKSVEGSVKSVCDLVEKISLMHDDERLI